MITSTDQQRQEQQEKEHQRRLETWQRQCFDRERYAECRLANFEITTPEQESVVAQLKDYATNLRENVASGKGILLFGSAGSGKTHLLAAMLRAAVVRFGIDVEWTRGVDIAATAKQDAQEHAKAMKNERYGNNYQSRELWSGPRYLKIFAIDDVAIPGEPLRFEVATRMHQVIDGAYQAKQPVFATINAAKKDEMAALLGGQIVDRLMDNALTLKCYWPSHRQPA